MIILNDHINPTSIGLFWAIYGRRNQPPHTPHPPPSLPPPASPESKIFNNSSAASKLDSIVELP